MSRLATHRTPADLRGAPLTLSNVLTDTAFKQQRLKAWQPILTPATVLPTFFLIGVIFLPLGGVLLWGSNKVRDYTIDYTQCEFVAPNDTFAQVPSSDYSYHLGSGVSAQAPSWQFQHDANGAVGQQSLCRINFELPVELKAPVFMYYKRAPSSLPFPEALASSGGFTDSTVHRPAVTNYYQNHRRYVKSLTSDQLMGKDVSYSSIKGGDCKPVDVMDGKIVYPCGLIANSLFNGASLMAARAS